MNAAEVTSTQTMRQQAKEPAAITPPAPMADIMIVLEQVQDMFAEIEVCGYPTDQDEVDHRGHLAMIAEINFGDGWAVPSPAEKEMDGKAPGDWSDAPSVIDTLHIPLKYHNLLAKGDTSARRIYLEREQLKVVFTACLDLAKSVDEYRWLVKMTPMEKKEAVVSAIATAVASWQANPGGASMRLARLHGYGTLAERQQQIEELLDGTFREEPLETASGGLFGLSIRRWATRKPVCPFDLDFAPFVHDVRYPLLVEFLLDDHQGRLSLAMISSVSAKELARASMCDRFEPRFNTFTVKEQSLLVGARNAIYTTGECDWTGWLTWTTAQRVAEAEDLLDKLTRGRIFVALCAEHGSAIEPYLDYLLDLLTETRFCRPEDQERRSED